MNLGEVRVGHFSGGKKCQGIIAPFLPTAEEKLAKKDAIRTNGKHYIEFKGSGNPKGPLAERMD